MTFNAARLHGRRAQALFAGLHFNQGPPGFWKEEEDWLPTQGFHRQGGVERGTAPPNLHLLNLHTL